MISTIKQAFIWRKKNRHAWLAVAMINIPLSISLALASGLDPLTGLLTGIWWCGIASLTASSKHNVFGIAGALSGIILLFSKEFWAERVPLLTIVSGVLTIIIRFSGIIKYITLIPAAALHGFVIGVGIIIMSNQFLDLVGLHTIKHAPWLIATMQTLFNNIASWNRYTLSIGISVVIFLILRKKYGKRLPGAVLATVIGAVLWLLAKHGIIADLYTLQDKFPDLQFTLLQFPFAQRSREKLQIPLIMGIVKTSAVIAIIAIVETIVSAKIATKMTKQSFDKNLEVSGLGWTNLLGWFLGIAPTTAVFVRTALNIKSWATEKSAALITAIATAAISLFLFDNFFLYLPLGVIAGILIHIAMGMINLQHLKHVSTIDKQQLILIIIVALVTVFEDPIVGILAWVGWSLLLQVAEKTKPHLVCSWFRNGAFVNKWTLAHYQKDEQAHDLVVIKLPSEISYINSDAILQELQQFEHHHHIIFSCSQIYAIDLDGLEIIDDMIEELESKWCTCHLTGTADIEHQLKHVKRYKHMQHDGHVRDNTSKCLDYFLRKQ